MKKRIGKKIRKKNEALLREKLCEIMGCVFDINGPNPRAREETGELPTVFLDFSGHVGIISISINSRGWHYDDDYYYDTKISAHVSSYEELCSAVKKLEEYKKDMCEVKNDAREN